jgi:hypothetical protein
MVETRADGFAFLKCPAVAASLNGWVITAAVLVKKHPRATDAQIRSHQDDLPMSAERVKAVFITPPANGILDKPADLP